MRPGIYKKLAIIQGNIVCISRFCKLPYSWLFSKQKFLQERQNLNIKELKSLKITIFEELQIVMHVLIIKNVG